MATRVGGFTVDYTCGCCGEGAWLLVGDCQSLTGTAALCGFSGYDDGTYDSEAPGDWAGQYRKWQDREISGDLAVTSGACMEGQCDVGTNGGTNYGEDYSGTSRLTCAGFESHALRDRTQYDAAGPGVCNSFNVGSADIDSLNDSIGTLYTIASTCGAEGTIPGFSQVYTLTTRTVSGCGCQSVLTSTYYSAGEAVETLADEHYFYDALAALLAEGGDVEEGEECCTTLTDADLTEPESQSSITLSGTAVRVPITIFGCSPVGIVMSVYLTLTQGENTYEVEIGIPCMVPTMVYLPLAAPGDDPICFERASLTPS